MLEYPNSLRPIAADNGELGGGVAELVKEMIRQVEKQGCRILSNGRPVQGCGAA